MPDTDTGERKSIPLVVVHGIVYVGLSCFLFLLFTQMSGLSQARREIDAAKAEIVELRRRAEATEAQRQAELREYRTNSAAILSGLQKVGGNVGVIAERTDMIKKWLTAAGGDKR